MKTVHCPKPFFFWGGDQVFASQIKTKEEIFLGDTNPLKGQLYASHLLYKVKHPISTWRQSIVQNSFILFLGTKSLHHRPRLRKRLFWVTPTPWRVSFMPPISCTKSNTWSAHKDSPLSKTVLSSFLRTKSLHQRSRLRKRYFGWHQPPERPALCLPSLVQSQTPDQRLKTVQYPKQFGYSCIFFRSFSWT